ncbi:MAG: hypothetical protein HY696_01455 [Deltaproteobacteria bacterium]|nr:hypothetical protein [Deltaproteobacteria bacterium]
MAMDPFITKAVSSTVTSVTHGAHDGGVSAVKPAGGDSLFQQVLGQMGNEMSQEDLAKSAGIMPSDLAASNEPFTSVSAQGIEPLPEYTAVGGQSGTGMVVDLLQEVNQGMMKMDHFLSEILYSGKRFSNQELLAVQARIYHWSQLSELTVKVAQEGVSSTRSLLNTQVQ